METGSPYKYAIRNCLTVNLEPLGARGSCHLGPANNRTESRKIVLSVVGTKTFYLFLSFYLKILVQMILHMKFQSEMFLLMSS